MIDRRLTPRERLARTLALLVPAGLLAGAWGSQLIGHLYPCEMCHWQRWPHYAAVVSALLAFVVPRPAIARALVVAAALLIAASGAIGVFHAGVEYHWWHGVTACSGRLDLAGMTPSERLARIMSVPVIPCDIAQWRFAGLSLAGFNAILSLGAATTILVLMGRRR